MSLAATSLDATSLVSAIGNLPADVESFTVFVDRVKPPQSTTQVLIHAAVTVFSLGLIALVFWLMVRSAENDVRNRNH